MGGAVTAGGWFNQFKRTKRWEGRAIEALVQLPAADFHDALDFSLAYFSCSHSLRDWLIEDGAINKGELDRLLRQHPEWDISRDLSNKFKHLTISRKPKDPDWSISREYDPFSPALVGREVHHANLFFAGQKHRLIDVVRGTSRMWESILSEKNLLP